MTKTLCPLFFVIPAMMAATATAETRQWLIVVSDAASGPLQENVSQLRKELSGLTEAKIEIVTADRLTSAQKATCRLIVTGQYQDNRLAQEILDAHLLSAPFAQDKEFVRQQGYVIASVDRVILAAGWDRLGSVYAVSHLRTHMQSSHGRLFLDLESSSTSGQLAYKLYRPDLEERAIYYNIAFGISFGHLTPDNWTEKDWYDWIDKAVCAQFTHIYFFLWGDETCFAKSNLGAKQRNRILHERLSQMIKQAHQRGLKVTYQFSPTQIPQDISRANEHLLKASIVYNERKKANYCVCQAVPDKITLGDYSWNGAMDLITDIYSSQMKIFAEADEFHLWFYDVGGCFCGPEKHNCRGHQAQRMMELVDTFYPIGQRINPHAVFTVNLWPVWSLEGLYNMRYREEFLDLLARYTKNDGGTQAKITVSDAVSVNYYASEHQSTTLIQAGSRNLRLNGFIFPTNIESGYVFVNPMLVFLKHAAEQSRRHPLSALHCMRIEEGSKFANTFIASRYFWDRSQSPDQVLRQYVRWIANSNAEAQEELFAAFWLLESFTNDGSENQDHQVQGARIKQLVQSALGRLGPAPADDLEWLLTTAQAMAILGEAIEKPERAEELSRIFSELISASPTFRPFGPYASSKFSTYCQWLKQGWINHGF